MTLSRRGFVAGLSTLAAAAALASRASAATVDLKVRWYGGGVYELAMPDDSVIVLVDAWIWNNTGFARFNLTKPPELASAAAYADSIKARNPGAFIVPITHDHGDHFGDYFELLKVLTDRGIDVKTVGQSDFMRVFLKDKFTAQGFDNTKLVLNGGNGINAGGSATYKGVKFTSIPAVHSMGSGYPPIGYIIEMNGVRVWSMGDTDLYGDMALVGKRYRPDVAFPCVGGGPFTMGPDDAATACQMGGVTQAIPVHYAHSPLVLGPETGDAFKAAMRRVDPMVAVTVLKPGESTRLHVTPRARV